MELNQIHKSKEDNNETNLNLYQEKNSYKSEYVNFAAKWRLCTG